MSWDAKPDGFPFDELFQYHVKIFRKQFVTESWALYGLAITSVMLRFIARIRRFGVQGLMIDVGLMVFCTATFTAMTVGINELLRRGMKTAFLPPFAMDRWSDADIQRFVGNAKWMYSNAHMLTLTMWSAKFCMVILYLRITDGLVARRWLLGVGVYVGLCFVGTELALFLSCMPIRRRWEPGTDMNCSFYDDSQVAEAVFSTTSTFAILAVGLPILLRARLPRRQKGIVLVLFSLGIFEVAADILLKVSATKERTWGFRSVAWYMRVCCVAMLVCNLPHTWSLLIDIFPRIRSWANESGSDSTPRFWREARMRRPSSRTRLRRGPSIDAPSSTPDRQLVTESTVDMTYPKPVLDAKSPTIQRFAARMDAAVIGRMIDGELEDEIDLDMITSRKVFLDIESAVAVARGNGNADGLAKTDSNADSAWTPPNSAGGERDLEKGGFGKGGNEKVMMR